MKDKIKNIYTEIGKLSFKTTIKNNISTVVVSRKDKIELIIKKYHQNKSEYIIYYNSDIDLEKFVETDYMNDLYKAENKIDNYHNILKKIKNYSHEYHLKTLGLDDYIEKQMTKLIKFLKLTNEEKKMHLNKNNEMYTFFDINDSLKIETTLGNLIVELNQKDFPEGFIVKLNGSPILLIESTEHINQNKLVLKRYPNKNVIHNDDYINLKAYQIDKDELNEDLIKSILNDLEEE